MKSGLDATPLFLQVDMLKRNVKRVKIWFVLKSMSNQIKYAIRANECLMTGMQIFPYNRNVITSQMSTWVRQVVKKDQNLVNVVKECPLILRTLWNRYIPRFFDQVGHQTMYASMGNKHFFTKSCHRQTYQNYEQS